MSRQLPAAVLLCLGLILLGGCVWRLPVSPLNVPAGDAGSIVKVAAVSCGLAAGCVLVLASTWVLIASRSRSSTAMMPLNWFVPALRKHGPARARWLRGFLPRSFSSDRTTKRRGYARRALRAVGISWLSAPVRRVAQACCFALFLVLFFWVCWPYDARPADGGAIARDWLLAEISEDARAVEFEGTAADAWLTRGAEVHVVDQELPDPIAGYLLTARVQKIKQSQLKLSLSAALTEQEFDKLLTHAGSWAVYERRPGAWPSHYADNLNNKERIPAELFLTIDPLVSLSTAIASRNWVWSLVCAAIILIVCVLIPRGFCGYVCPLGTLIDLFDWAIGRRITRFRVSGDGWWVHVKYYLLLATLLSACGGVLVSGYVAAIPVITRGMLFLGEPLQSGSVRGWHLTPAMGVAHVVSVGLFLGVLLLGLLRPRFWCKYVCPSGATFSLANLFRASERKVESSCINCNKCVEACPFDAIKPDFTTRVTDCTLCQTCGGVCPTHAIKFVERWNRVELKVINDPPTGETKLGRRGFLSLSAGTAAAVAGSVGAWGATKGFGARLDDPAAILPVRPPGSVPEQEFLQMCIRCGECFKACPNNVLQVEGFQQGLEGLWTPLVNADWAGCESSCNACGQVCPTGAIRALPMEEKKAARMGLAIVNQETCLPIAGKEACQLCVDECVAAGYDAIEFEQVHTLVDDDGLPIADSGFLAPVVLADKCVGCGLCQTRCYAINVKNKHLLSNSAIVIEAGPGREDRLLSGSYLQLRAAEQRANQDRDEENVPDYFVPEFDNSQTSDESPNTEEPGDSDPFGVGQ